MPDDPEVALAGALTEANMECCRGSTECSCYEEWDGEVDCDCVSRHRRLVAAARAAGRAEAQEWPPKGAGE